MRNPVIRALLACCGVICAILGIVGAFVPVLPTTPLLLLAAFLFARSSERLDRWLASTKVYQAYVVPFREKRGIETRVKNRILLVSLAVMLASAFAVRGVDGVNYLVWGVLAAVYAWLLYLMKIRIPNLVLEKTPVESPQRDAAAE